MENNKELVKEAYNGISQIYYETFYHVTKDYPYVDSFINELNGTKILDLGCGCGHFARYIKDNLNGAELTCVDFAEKQLEIAREVNPDIEFLCHDICELPEKLTGYDGIMLIFVLQHLSKEQTKLVLNNAFSRANKNCKIFAILDEGNFNGFVPEPFDSKYSQYIQQYSRQEIKELLKDCGWLITDMKFESSNDENSCCNNKMIIYAQKENIK